MTVILSSPLGPIDFLPRDLERWPRNSRPPTADTSRLRGMTGHYAGGAIARYYKNATERAGDEALWGATIASHNARPGLTDVGYNLGLGRSGLLMDGRGVVSMNGANGELLASARPQFPTGTRTSNPFFVSVFVCVGTDAGFDRMTAQQREVLPRVFAYLVDLLKIPNPIVNGHRDVRATACPGADIYAELDDVEASWPPPPACAISNPLRPEWSCWPSNKAKPSIGPGSSGDAVAYLHGVLRAYGYSAPTGGVWSSLTGRAVGAVQRSNKLPVDNVVGPATWEVIDALAMKAKAK